MGNSARSRTACSVDQVTQEDPSWPMVLIVQTSDGEHGSHAITTWNGMIFDSNAPNALCWSQKSLDWCSGKDSACIGFSKVCRLCPADFSSETPRCAIQIGTQVQRHSELPDALGWIVHFPTKKKNGQEKKGCIVFCANGAKAELSHLDVLKCVLKK